MERLPIIETLKYLPDAIETEVTGLLESVLRYRPDDGDWSIIEVVGHLRDAAEVWQGRLYQVWSQTDPLFVSFDGEVYVRERGYQAAVALDLIAEMRTFRLRTVDLLSEAVDWTRIGRQPGVGRRSLRQFAEFVIGHDSDHLAQIRTLKLAQG